MQDRVGIFGGSFNPVHRGHISAARSFLHSNLIDSLWILPAPDPPHKPEMDMAPFHHRLEMLNIAFRNIRKTEIHETEAGLPRPSYTLQTVRYLIKQYPDKRFSLCIGSDSLETFTSWYHYRELLALVKLLVAARPGSEYSGIPDEVLQRVVFIDHEPVEVSSTHIREKGTEEGAGRSLLTEEVEAYIRLHGLYQNTED